MIDKTKLAELRERVSANNFNRKETIEMLYTIEVLYEENSIRHRRESTILDENEKLRRVKEAAVNEHFRHRCDVKNPCTLCLELNSHLRGRGRG